jgi:putative Holliday junction resolvase
LSLNNGSGTSSALPYPQRGTVLGFDYGLKRIGVAVGEFGLAITHPLETIRAESNEQRFAAIARLVTEWKPVLVVVGLPSHLDGTEHEMSAQCRRFARRLEGRFGVRTALADERLSSAAASEYLSEAGVRGRKQKDMLDQVAAQQILQTFFESCNASTQQQ